MKRRAVVVQFCVFAVLAGLFYPASALAQNQVYSPEQLKNYRGRFENRRVIVQAKFKWAVFGDSRASYIKLINEQKIYFLPNTKIGRDLGKDRDEKGAKLERRSNVQIVVRVLRNQKLYKNFPTGQAVYVFILESIIKLEDDVKLFKKRMVKSIAEKPLDHSSLRAIANKASEWAKRYSIKDPKSRQEKKAQSKIIELKAFALMCIRRSLEIQAKQLAKDDYQGTIKLAKQYLKRLGDRRKAIAMLNDVASEKPPQEVSNELVKLLKSWSAYYFRKRWIGYAELKQQQGFVLRDSKWVLRERAEFLDEVASHIKNKSNTLFLPPAETLLNKASRGQETIGQTRNMIVNMVLGNGRIGFPTYVDRIERKVKSEMRVYVQWIYRGQHRFYFINGTLFSWHRSNSPYPDK
jgi:hypothetical protein